MQHHCLHRVSPTGRASDIDPARSYPARRGRDTILWDRESPPAPHPPRGHHLRPRQQPVLGALARYGRGVSEALEHGRRGKGPTLVSRGWGTRKNEFASAMGRATSGPPAREEISVVNPAPAGGSSQRRLSPPAHVLLPHHATASGDQWAERTCHRARHRQTHAPWMDQAARARA